MSNDNPQGGGPVATATPGSPIHVNVQMPSSESKQSSEDSGSSKKVDKRVAKLTERAQEKGAKGVLKGLGIAKEEREGILKELRETRSAKSLAEKLQGEHKSRAEKAEAELKLIKDQMGTYEALAKSYADEQFNALPESLQKFITATAGDSLQARLNAIKTAKESGLITAKEAAAATAQAKSDEKPAKPATTSNAVNPKAPSPAADLSHRQIWQQMKQPVEGETDGQAIARKRIAAQYYAQHAVQIDNEWV